jgi:hypothetical protein
MRVFLAFIMILYATAKFLGGQFITEGPLLDTPISQMSGIELTWVYFGSSKLYSLFLASSQWLGGFLLLYWRTVRLALLILVPMMANIVIVNYSFDISPGTRVVSVLYLTMFLALAALEWQGWLGFFWPQTNRFGPSSNEWSPRRWIARIALALAVAGIPWLVLSHVANNYYQSSPVLGNWRITQWESEGVEVPGFQKMYFQKANRYAMGLGRFIYPGDYEVDRDEIVFTVSYWPSPDELRLRKKLQPDIDLTRQKALQVQREERQTFQFRGQYQMPSDNRLELSGTLDGNPCRIQLEKE